MKKVVFTALCIASVVALPGCWCSKEEKQVEPVTQEAVAPEAQKPAEEAAKQAEQAAAPATQKPTEEVPAKM